MNPWSRSQFQLRVRPKSPSLTVGVRKEPGFPPVLGRTLRMALTHVLYQEEKPLRAPSNRVLF